MQNMKQYVEFTPVSYPVQTHFDMTIVWLSH